MSDVSREARRTMLYLPLAAAFVGLVVSANWLASAYVWSVPFTDYAAPGGWVVIGAALVCRDWLQQLKGLLWTMPLVYAAGLISWAVGDLAGWTGIQRIAIASVVAFSVSETAEALVFTPIRNRSLSLGVALSGTVGSALDSFLFLWIAFGSQAYFAGNTIGKLEMVALGSALTLFRRRLLPVVV